MHFLSRAVTSDYFPPYIKCCKHDQTREQKWTYEKRSSWLWSGLTLNDETPLVFQGVRISFWLPMCFTIYRSQSPLASVPWAILSSSPLSPSATLFLYCMFSILLSHRAGNCFYNAHDLVMDSLKSVNLTVLPLGLSSVTHITVQ